MANTLAQGGWQICNSMFRWYDGVYHKFHRLYDIDDFISVKKCRYNGKPKTLADGTELKKGDDYLALHFNNGFLAAIQSQHGLNSRRRVALAFGTAIVGSMQTLYNELQQNPDFKAIDVITGITWFKTHGEKIGFEAHPMPEGPRKAFLRLHFKILLWSLFPQLAARENKRLDPHQFWLTRQQLHNTVTRQEDNYVAQRLSRYHHAREAI